MRIQDIPTAEATPSWGILPRIIHKAFTIALVDEPELVTLKVVGKFRVSLLPLAALLVGWNIVIMHYIETKEHRIGL